MAPIRSLGPHSSRLIYTLFTLVSTKLKPFSGHVLERREKVSADDVCVSSIIPEFCAHTTGSKAKIYRLCRINRSFSPSLISPRLTF
jgi:hypothetical protein